MKKERIIILILSIIIILMVLAVTFLPAMKVVMKLYNPPKWVLIAFLTDVAIIEFGVLVGMFAIAKKRRNK